MEAPHKYGLLRFIAFVLKLLAWLMLLMAIAGAVIGGLGVAGPMRALPQIPTGFLLAGIWSILLIGVIGFVGFYTVGGILTLLEEIERHTRALTTQPTTPQSGPPAAP